VSEVESCALCGASLVGRYCHACGQKRIEPGDRSLAHLLGVFWRELTALDGRWWASFRDLVIAPGRLSAAWIEGRPQRYLMPVTLFLLVNVLYFLRAPMTDFNLSLLDQACLQPWSASVVEWATPRIAPETFDCAQIPAEDSQLAALVARYAELSDEVSRSFVIAHVPVLALFLFLLGGWRSHYYADHLVVALHLMAFLLLYAIVLLPVAWLLLTLAGPGESVGSAFRMGLALVLLAHWTLAVRRAYGLRWPRTLLAPVVLIAGLGISHFAYRWAQFWIVAWQLG
jgi:hypothetical protein